MLSENYNRVGDSATLPIVLDESDEADPSTTAEEEDHKGSHAYSDYIAGWPQDLCVFVHSTDPGTSHLACASALIFMTQSDFARLKRPPIIDDILKPSNILRAQLFDLRQMEKQEHHIRVPFHECQLYHSGEYIDRLRHLIQEHPHAFNPRLAFQWFLTKNISRYFTQSIYGFPLSELPIHFICEQQPPTSPHVVISNLIRTELSEKLAMKLNSTTKIFPESAVVHPISPVSFQSWMNIRNQSYEERKDKTTALAQSMCIPNQVPVLYAKANTDGEFDRIHDVSDAICFVRFYAENVILPRWVRMWYLYQNKYHCSKTLTITLDIDDDRRNQTKQRCAQLKRSSSKRFSQSMLSSSSSPSGSRKRKLVESINSDCH